LRQVARFCVQFFRTLIEIMPQITAEKKFFRIEKSENSQKTAAEIIQSFTVIKLQGFQENITGGKE
jgi:hypothetical protein